jgi:hypothetical protein
MLEFERKPTGFGRPRVGPRGARICIGPPLRKSATRESYPSTLRRLEDTTSETAEPAIAFENQGEMPTLTDQGEGQAGPTWNAVRESADTVPLSVDVVEANQP